MREVAGRSGYVIFKPRARLLRLLGAELISDEIVAVTELVKNAHDADASAAVIEFRDVMAPGGSITILDDGCGMDLQTLLRNWMEPAGTSKSGGPRQRTVRGRRVLEEKGIGRFAVDKLARRLELISRCPGSDTEIVATFDWDRFDSDTEMLSDVRNHWRVRAAEVIEGHGTTLRMTGLRTTWSERMFRRLCTRLARLQSPFRGTDGFMIKIDSDEFPRYSGELRPEFLERAPYRIEASFDGERAIEVSISGGPRARQSWSGSPQLSCGPVRIRIFAFDLESEALARIGPKMETRAWLREWSGVSIYRDGFRVWPYGEPHDDWLRLDQRRVNNPVVRLSNNQVVGFVEISRERNPGLGDQTNREGLISNRAFEDLRKLMYSVLQILEAERQTVRHPRSRDGKVSVTSRANGDSVLGMLEALARRMSGGVASEILRVSARVRQTLDQELGMRRRLLELYTERAALGHAGDALFLATRPLLEEIRDRCRDLVALPGQSGRRVKQESSKLVTTLVDSVTSRLEAILSASQQATRRRRAIDVLVELRRVRDFLEPALDRAGVRMVLRGSGLIRAEIRPENFQRLMCTLATNALHRLSEARKPEIRITAKAEGDRCEIVFSDNGRGIRRHSAERAFDPVLSGRENGHGTGLMIARSLVNLHGGSIELQLNGRRRGAHLRILLPRKRSRATVTRQG